LDVAVAILAVVAVLVAVGVGVYYGVFHNKDAPKTGAVVGASGASGATGATGGQGPAGASGASGNGAAPNGAAPTGCGRKLADKSLQWGAAGSPASVKGRKAVLVGSGWSDACTDAAEKQAREDNPSALFQSAYKMTSDDKSVYYLSQFVDVNLPAALSEADRKSYTKYVAKSGSTFASPVDTARGLECELLVRPAPSTEGEARSACLADARCAGYYKSSTREPVLAMAGPGKCTLWWTKLPTADQPQEADVCRKFLGDKLWKTDGEGFCVPECTADRTNTDFCTRCDRGWGKSGTNHASNTCVPVKEETCPTGWELGTDGNYPNGVCRPKCKDTLGREEDGYCGEHKGNCIPGYTAKKYDRHYYCKPNAGLIKNEYYKPAT
jgi:hypothetical protein